jgi:hypothetical protein
MRAGKLLIVAIIILFSYGTSRAQFSATLLYGIPIPVCTWNGQGTAFDFAMQSLDSSHQQGKLVILGRDSKNLWFFQGGCSNDAQDSCFSFELGSIDSAGKVKFYYPPAVAEEARTFRQRFTAEYRSLFKKHQLSKLIPVTTWSCAYPQSWVAQVNSRELNSCFQFSYLITSAGGCWNEFEWATERLPYQLSRTVRFENCTIIIPSDWTYKPYENKTGYVSDGKDTMYYRTDPPIRMVFDEMIEYILLYENDSVHIKKNERVRKYNDSLHAICPEMVTHTRVMESVGNGYTERWYPKEGVTSWMRYAYYRDERFEFQTTVLTPEKQIVWKKVLDSLEHF